ncbi:MAG: ATP-binding cassette domain-containing protein [Canibacter sp.]
MSKFNLDSNPVMRVSDLSLEYPAHSGARSYAAVQGVSFDLERGGVMALLGESGSGKSTLARTLAGRAQEAPQRSDRIKVTGGAAQVFEVPIRRMRRKDRNLVTGHTGYLAQNAGATLTPEFTVADILMQPIRERDKHFDANLAGEKVAEMFETVALPLEMLQRYPYELSKGQRQRIAVMQSLMLEPSLLVADEPTLGIDATHRPSVVNLLKWYRERTGATLMLICHDIGMLEALVESVLVMQEGQIVGRGSINTIFRDIQHEYVEQLAQALRTTAYDEISVEK